MLAVVSVVDILLVCFLSVVSVGGILLVCSLSVVSVFGILLVCVIQRVGLRHPTRRPSSSSTSVFLLTRFQHYFGISGPALSWFSSYLCNRTHAVTINSLQSEHTTLHYGVPQGSVLGPVLFILYTQPLFNLVIKHAVNHHAFADDKQFA